MKVYAPGKLILSGEHAVVYGKPALAMAVNRYATATITRDTVPQFLVDLSDLAHHSRLSVSSLQHLKARIKRKYHRFIRGDFSIRDVLQKPFELAQFALSIIADSLNLSLPHGVKIHVQSTIPVGCGMGSSAATIISVMHAVSHYFQIPVSKEALFKLALEAEKMQHGYSSGLDLKVALFGGCLFVEGEHYQHRSLPQLPMYLVNTGAPLATTGQCVEKVAPFFQSGQLGDEFAAVTKAMDQALQAQNMAEFAKTIKANHQLLVQIGVVPDKVNQFITEVEKLGGVAKVCGAGSIYGDRSGALLVSLEDERSVNILSARFGYEVLPIVVEARGVHAV